MQTKRGVLNKGYSQTAKMRDRGSEPLEALNNRR